MWKNIFLVPLHCTSMRFTQTMWVESTKKVFFSKEGSRYSFYLGTGGIMKLVAITLKNFWCSLWSDSCQLRPTLTRTTPLQMLLGSCTQWVVRVSALQKAVGQRTFRLQHELHFLRNQDATSSHHATVREVQTQLDSGISHFGCKTSGSLRVPTAKKDKKA